MFYMELALGQHERRGAITCWGETRLKIAIISHLTLAVSFRKSGSVVQGKVTVDA